MKFFVFAFLTFSTLLFGAKKNVENIPNSRDVMSQNSKTDKDLSAAEIRLLKRIRFRALGDMAATTSVTGVFHFIQKKAGRDLCKIGKSQLLFLLLGGLTAGTSHLALKLKSKRLAEISASLSIFEGATVAVVRTPMLAYVIAKPDGHAFFTSRKNMFNKYPKSGLAMSFLTLGNLGLGISQLYNGLDLKKELQVSGADDDNTK